MRSWRRQAGTELEVDVTPAADLPRGRYELWVASPAARASKLRVYVDELAQANETEPNDELAQANDTTLESDMWGVLAAKGDIDRFAFDAQAGQSLVFDLTGSTHRLEGQLSCSPFPTPPGACWPTTTTSAARAIRCWPFTYRGRRPIRRCEVRDLMRGGGGEHFYRLSLGELAVPTAVFPLSVPANQEAEVEVTGYNLPRG